MLRWDKINNKEIIDNTFISTIIKYVETHGDNYKGFTSENGAMYGLMQLEKEDIYYYLNQNSKLLSNVIYSFINIRYRNQGAEILDLNYKRGEEFLLGINNVEEHFNYYKKIKIKIFALDNNTT